MMVAPNCVPASSLNVADCLAVRQVNKNSMMALGSLFLGELLEAHFHSLVKVFSMLVFEIIVRLRIIESVSLRRWQLRIVRRLIT